MKVTSSLTSTLLGGLVFFAAQSAYAAKIPLVTFFSAARGDHFTTSNPLVFDATLTLSAPKDVTSIECYGAG